MLDKLVEDHKRKRKLGQSTLDAKFEAAKASSKPAPVIMGTMPIEALIYTKET